MGTALQRDHANFVHFALLVRGVTLVVVCVPAFHLLHCRHAHQTRIACTRVELFHTWTRSSKTEIQCNRKYMFGRKPLTRSMHLQLNPSGGCAFVFRYFELCMGGGGVSRTPGLQ